MVTRPWYYLHRNLVGYFTVNGVLRFSVRLPVSSVSKKDVKTRIWKDGETTPGGYPFPFEERVPRGKGPFEIEDNSGCGRDLLRLTSLIRVVLKGKYYNPVRSVVCLTYLCLCRGVHFILGTTLLVPGAIPTQCAMSRVPDWRNTRRSTLVMNGRKVDYGHRCRAVRLDLRNTDT